MCKGEHGGRKRFYGRFFLSECMHFREISKEAHAFVNSQSWFALYGKNLLIHATRFLLLVAGFFVFALHGVLFKIVGLTMISYATFGLAITLSHDTSHYSVVRSRKINKLLAYVVSDFFAGQSNKWWMHRHVTIHHIHTNMDNKVGSVFAFHKMHPFFFFFVLPYAALFYLVGFSFHFLWGKWKDLALYAVLMIAGVALETWLFALFVPWYYALLSVLIARSSTRSCSIWVFSTMQAWSSSRNVLIGSRSSLKQRSTFVLVLSCGGWWVTRSLIVI